MVFDVDDTDLMLHAFTPRRFKASARESQPQRRRGLDKRYCFDYGEAVPRLKLSTMLPKDHNFVLKKPKED